MEANSGWFVTANDIVKWTETNKRRAEEILPLLVQKLLLVSCKPKEIAFPSGDQVQIGGWDGILDVEEGNQFIPSGKSSWEFGTTSNATTKANDDYAKRTITPKPLRRREVTFVFVTSRLWSKKSTWVAGKKKERKWKDVKGLNADDLESWLAQCPSVHRWFSRLVGKRTDRLWDLEQAWDSLSNVTTIPLNSELFINGRESEKEELFKRLGNNASIIRIKAQSKNEANGFILSALMKNSVFSNRVIIVKEQSAWDWVLEFDNSLILIPEGFTPKALGSAIAKGHFVIEALGDYDSASADIRLERMSRGERINALISMGLSEQHAEQTYADTHGYLEPILRHTKLIPLDRIPTIWNTNISLDVLFAVLFATEWEENNNDDRKAVSSLAGMTYESLEKVVTELSKQSDPPIRLLGNVWQVISKIDMWHIIAPRLTKLQLERLGIVAKQLIADIDPSFDLAPEERYMASIKGAVPLYSSRLKQGVADSLALLAAYGDNYLIETNLRPSDYVRIWVRQVFETSEDAKSWYSIGRSLPSLAESAPEEFLTAVAKMSTGETPPILGLFESEGNGFLGGCPHADLLWSLERISWNKSHFSLASSALARLAEIDPGGKYSNRPFKSLVDIFLGWINNTQTTHDERLQIIRNVLLDRHPTITWKLLIALLPHNTGYTSGINKPVYRDWAIETDRTVLRREYHTYISEIENLLFEEVERNINERLLDLLANIGKLDDKHQREFINYLKDKNLEALSASTREKVTDKLREFVSQNREFSDAKWAEDDDLLTQLEEIYRRIEPADVVTKNLYLFEDYFPHLLHPLAIKDSDYKQKEELITKTRVSAIEEIFEEKGFDGIEELTRASKYPTSIGHVLPKSKYSGDFQRKIEEWVEKDDPKFLELVRMFVASKQDDAWAYTEQLLADNAHWSIKIRTNLLLSLPVEERTFTIVDKQSDEIEKDYWSRLYNYAFFFKKLSEAQYVANKFLEHDRPLAALGSISQYLERSGDDNVDINLVASILKRIISDPSDIDGRLKPEFHRYLSSAIRFIEASQELSENEIIQIEWAFLPVFRYDDFIPNSLSKMVAKDASFFVELVKLAFRAKQDTKTGQLIDESTKNRAETAYDLLRKAFILPGDSGGVINADALNRWVDDARKLLQESDRATIGDDQIGTYLSHSPVGSDRIWPHEAVRSVIERIRSSEFDAGFITGRLNARGMTSRSPWDGGKQERDLAAQYNNDAKKIELIYPRTAEILRDIARNYESHARHEDWDSELHD
jgi:hypothetical protein